MQIKVRVSHIQNRSYKSTKTGQDTLTHELMGLDAEIGDNFTPGMITVSLRGEDQDKYRDLSTLLGRVVTVVPAYISTRTTGLAISGKVINVEPQMLPTKPEGEKK
jgi:hypothetical protein